MDNARAQELVANERARLERLLRAEIGATAPDQGDDVDDANWRIAEETGRAVSRSLRDRWSALERAEERLERGTYGRSIASGRPIPDERLEADPLAELLVEEADVEELEDGELIDEDDDEQAPAEFEDEAEHAQDAEDEEPQEVQEEQAAEEEEERPPQRRRSGR